MVKKRRCRRTDEERVAHDEAVAIRKLTDRQLVSQWRELKTAKETVEKELVELKKEVQRARKTVNSAQVPSGTKSPNEILTDISAIKGVGETILSQIKKVLYGNDKS